MTIETKPDRMSSLSSNAFRYIDSEYDYPFVGDALFNEGINISPLPMSSKVIEERRERHAMFIQFFRICGDIFKNSFQRGGNRAIYRFLLNDAEQWRPISFYRKFENIVLRPPHFFRTDESANGKVLEIQCPGSGWGDIDLLTRCYKEMGIAESFWFDRTGDRCAEMISEITEQESAHVFHMLDSASNPSSMRYFFRMTQPPLKYWGYHRDVRYAKVDYVRSHSVRSLFTENLFETRLTGAIDGKIFFDLPPNPIFDQKLLLCLPFEPGFREHFSDNIREMLAFSTLATPDGFRDMTGEFLSWSDFSKRSARHRRYFLKYGGCDTNVNWGSRAVFRLDGTNKNLRALLSSTLNAIRRGKPWIVQPEEAQKAVVSAVFRNGNVLSDQEMTSKHSCFYGPGGLVGIRTMHREHFKVHGQPSTVIGLPGVPTNG